MANATGTAHVEIVAYAGCMAVTFAGPPFPGALAQLHLSGTSCRGTALSQVLLPVLPPRGAPVGVVVNTGELLLRRQDLQHLQEALQQRNLELLHLCAAEPLTLVAAAGLGVTVTATASAAPETAVGPSVIVPSAGTHVHEVTLRAGDHLEHGGNVVVLGDVNPGALVQAAGHVVVWGRLRGIAHAGAGGNSAARIAALQLEAQQLRIADVVAIGPSEKATPGRAEQAVLRNREIVIEAARSLGHHRG